LSKDKWFEPSERSLNWSKGDSPTTRRRKALKARWNSPLKAARALRALANVTKDAETKQKAQSDASYFYKMYSKRKK